MTCNLEIENEELREERDNLNRSMVLIAAERDELRAEVERLKADGKRMDWLDSFNSEVAIQCEDGGIWIEVEDYKKLMDEPEKSLREAIDSAMKGELK